MRRKREDKRSDIGAESEEDNETNQEVFEDDVAFWEDDDGIDGEEEEMDFGEFDPALLFSFMGLFQLGIESSIAIAFLGPMLYAGISSVPYTFSYAATIGFFDRKKHPTNLLLIRDVGKNTLRSSLSVGIFAGSWMMGRCLSDTSDVDYYFENGGTLSGVISVSLAAIAYRKPILALSGVGILTTAALLKIIP